MWTRILERKSEGESIFYPQYWSLLDIDSWFEWQYFGEITLCGVKKCIYFENIEEARQFLKKRKYINSVIHNS
jgi:hypothetical protein